MQRREFLRAAGLGMAVSSLPGVAFANADTDSRLVLVILRGAVDGLALAAPYGDGNYEKVRGELALAAPAQERGLLKLDGLFGLHPSLPGLYRDFKNGEALIVHAIASPYRDRSHFDGQDVLENGGATVGAARDGWLNRALAPLGGSLGNETAIAMAQNTPLILRGENSVTSWAPSRLPDASESTIARLRDLYAEDEFFATRLAQALMSHSIATGIDGMKTRGPRGNEAAFFKTLMASTARFLTAPDGPGIAVLEVGGWDTHANQGTSSGALANRLKGLDGGLSALRSGLGDAWDTTVVAIVTEFGRTVRVNGTRGTDHGTATAAILTGGAINGGRVIADWPGLATSNLYEGRDLKPTIDLRSLFKGVLADHLSIPEALLEKDVFPGSSGAAVTRDLIRG